MNSVASRLVFEAQGRERRAGATEYGERRAT
jgi:hypothetical protein